MAAETTGALSLNHLARPLRRPWAEAWKRALPAGVSVGLAVVRRDAVVGALDGIRASGSLIESFEAGLLLASVVLSGLFYLMVAALFLNRVPATAGTNGSFATVVAMAGTWGTLPMAFLPITATSAWLTIPANVLMVVGMIGCLVALGWLGRNFGVRPRARGLVTHGPYSIVRHPLYTFEALAQLGVVLVVFCPLAVATFLVYAALQYRRAALEERLLAATFPAYREYQARTWRFIPGLV
ncbi:MAG TPA: isoprenylcysteine carboxylmethyltransferase family protein [Chloroflexota bacterium]|nr:isoprenylcysteine carboxylmethyltransferase family protein [Chloroflexota bacterium]